MKLAVALMLAMASTSAAATTVTINGTQGNDIIYIGVLQTKNLVTGRWTTVGPRKIVNGTVSVIASSFSGVTKLQVFAGAGNDYIEVVNSTYGNFPVSQTQRLAPWVLSGVRIEIDGDQGDDGVLGSDFGDTIIGGPGDDELVGAGGADGLYGSDVDGGGEDFICGGLKAGIDAGDNDYCSGDIGNNDDVNCFPESYGGPGTGDLCRNGGGGVYPTSCETRLACWFE